MRRVAGARSEDGTAIAKGAEVVVQRYEKGIAYVRRWEDMAGTASESRQSTQNDGLLHGACKRSVMQKDMVVVVVLLMVLAIVLIASMLARLYRKAGPHEALIVYGRGTRVVKGRGTVIFPMVETCRGCRSS